MLAAPFFDWHSQALFYFWSMDGVHGAERNYSSIWDSIMDNATLYSLKVEVVWVHKVHG
jgi:hypothetical protein